MSVCSDLSFSSEEGGGFLMQNATIQSKYLKIPHELSVKDAVAATVDYVGGEPNCSN